jgi:GNAT superfamily N-acetyltransferase
MATLEHVRGRGIGGLLLARGIREALDRKGILLWCNGRVSARQFYERHGMRAVGDEFESPNTGPHYLFTLDLRGVSCNAT